jgi:hypothetical protein
MLSEFAIIKACIEHPSVLDPSFKQLNLKHIRDPQATE